MSNADTEIAGGCRCKAIRYTMAIAEIPKAYACHCLDCQTWSGSAFSLQIVLPESALRVVGQVADYTIQGPSGALSHQRMCGTCHSRVYNTNSVRPGLAMLRAGTLDASDALDVPVHIWVKRKQPWLTLPAHAAVFEEAAPRDVIAALVAKART